ncbi:nucleoside recognition GATE domain-containing membrane protein YjiH [Halobiforma haloterrestris]|uniref:Nucleoside recognition GATE domain-containing membrane protein YjiH n=1 Tax=Natronobacterium haloterrestre TaxID=148448 RepID=A0A1I1G4E0_NATHA|nr:YjiH family protein [Halobiforma haloterrestris]SFC06607.1 nucleoside recognition GATE domain-containing membrane protein YjiH [Halobiforma haloterrestris]
MFDEAAWQGEEQGTKRIHTVEEPKRIEDIDLTEIRRGPVTKFGVAFLIGFVFFLVPVPWEGQVTVPFDIVVSWITDSFPTAAGVYALGLILAGGVLTTVAELRKRDLLSVSDGIANRLALSYWETSLGFWLFRVAGAVLAPVLFLEIGPGWLIGPATGGLVWGTLILSVAVIIPIGAIFINLFVELGGLEFVGTMARPIMRPLFKIPGRAALDSVASWVGSYSVGLYVTRNVFDRGEYSKRDVYIISTCFATVSIGFVGVVAATLDLLELFPIIFVAYLVCIAVSGIILVRIPPLSNVPEEYVAEPNPETPFRGSVREYVRFGLSEAVEKAETGDSIVGASVRGFVDGLKLAVLILGTILSIGLAAVVLAEHTPVFDVISRPLVLVIELLGIPDAEVVAPATIIGITEMFIPALLVVEADAMARFFIAVLSISQLIFFSATAPMMMDMFSDVPIRFRDLVVLFVMRTVILVLIIAAMTHLLAAVGLL